MATQLSQKQFAQYLRTGGVSPDPEPRAADSKTRDFNTVLAEMRADRADRKATQAARPIPQRKAGREISSANRDTIQNALDGMAEAMKALQTHHGAMSDLMRKTDPDRTRQDEYDVEGDDDTENGGHNINDGYPKSRSGYGSSSSATGNNAALVADLESVLHRLKVAQQTKQLQRDMDQLTRKMAVGSVRYNVKQLLRLVREHPDMQRPDQRLRDLLSNTPNATHHLATHKSQALSAVAMLKQLAPEIVGTGAESDMVPVAGYLSTWDLDLGGDICDPGCYTQTITDLKAEQARTHSRFLIPMLWQHNMQQPIGGWTSLEQDSYGLFAMGLIDPDTELGAQALSALRKGYACGLSIGYTIVKSYRGSDGARHLQEIDLGEGSVVTLAMNPMASVTTLH